MSYERTPEVCETLANAVVDSWDMDTLVSFAQEQLFIQYQNPLIIDDEAFEDDCEMFLGD